MHFLKLLIFLLIVGAVRTSAQDITVNKWQFGVFATPKMDYRIIRSDGFDDFSQLVIESRNERDEARLGLDIGIAGFLNINDHWQLKTGFEYAKWGYKDNGFTVNGSDSTAGPAIYVVTYFDRSTILKDTFFKFPIGLRYHFSADQSRISPFLETNFKPSFHSTLFKNFDWYASASFAFGVAVPAHFIHQLYFGLNFDYFLKRFPDNDYNVHPYSIGLEIGYIFW